ncbi:hypothetical protein G6O69_27880 [Pseudenhygromyxa sp. WMMC2535]|uniref:RCC1-like domain-containing protein n=1 Tax=Pseudenhygromyxa sp. WMMC2535 TaxID=2712867 RepID=UPI001554DDDC|nr:RCC1 domain-containing protein [Pseudenhygromyxa sp. WMMC2535]NVB41688.1 hypothetical protein [Pseudenhygromyxa sp. WMMC2535]
MGACEICQRCEPGPSSVALGWRLATLAAATSMACTVGRLDPSPADPVRSSSAPAASPALLPGPCLVRRGRVECDRADAIANGQRDVVDLQRGEDRLCVLYRDGRLVCDLSELRRYAFEGVDAFALDGDVLCTLDRDVGATCRWNFGAVPGYEATHPEFAAAEGIWVAGELGLCGRFAELGLRCVPVAVPDAEPSRLPEAVEVAAEGELICVREREGTVRCWGEALGGPRFDRHVDPRPPVVIAGLPVAVELDVGRAHACARDEHGGVWCWGHGDDGQLAQGLPVGSSVVAVPVWPQIEARALWVEGDHSCGLERDATTLADVRCWGRLPTSWARSLAVGTTTEPGPSRLPEPVEPRCVAVDLDRWAAAFTTVDAGLDLSRHLAELGLARHDAELFWTQAVARAVELRSVELDGRAPREQLVIARLDDPHARHVFVRPLFARDDRWCIEPGTMIHLAFDGHDALTDRARAELDGAGISAPDPVTIEASELFDDGREALLLRALAGRDRIMLDVWAWDGRMSEVAADWLVFEHDAEAGVTWTELERDAGRGARLRTRGRVECDSLVDPRGCEPRRWEALWQLDGYLVELERHEWRGVNLQPRGLHRARRGGPRGAW